jgi:hypothetical protein
MVTVINFIGTFSFLGLGLQEAHAKTRAPFKDELRQKLCASIRLYEREVRPLSVDKKLTTRAADPTAIICHQLDG